MIIFWRGLAISLILFVTIVMINLANQMLILMYMAPDSIQQQLWIVLGICLLVGFLISITWRILT